MVTLTPYGGGGRHSVLMLSTVLLLCCFLFARPASASEGDRLPEFRECLKVRPPVSTVSIAAES